jgi:hypothetical protein
MKRALARCTHMPMLRCHRCELPTYTAARWSTRDECARCGAVICRSGAPYPRVMTGSPSAVSPLPARVQVPPRGVPALYA